MTMNVYERNCQRKEELRKEFDKNCCGYLWCPTYDFSFVTYEEVIDECVERAGGMLSGDSSDTPGMKAFVAMVNSWT